MVMGVPCVRRVYPHLNECFPYTEGVFTPGRVTIAYFFPSDTVQLFLFFTRVILDVRSTIAWF